MFPKINIVGKFDMRMHATREGRRHKDFERKSRILFSIISKERIGQKSFKEDIVKEFLGEVSNQAVYNHLNDLEAGRLIRKSKERNLKENYRINLNRDTLVSIVKQLTKHPIYGEDFLTHIGTTLVNEYFTPFGDLAMLRFDPVSEDYSLPSRWVDVIKATREDDSIEFALSYLVCIELKKQALDQLSMEYNQMKKLSRSKRDKEFKWLSLKDLSLAFMSSSEIIQKSKDAGEDVIIRLYNNLVLIPISILTSRNPPNAFYYHYNDYKSVNSKEFQAFDFLYKLTSRVQTILFSGLREAISKSNSVPEYHGKRSKDRSLAQKLSGRYELVFTRFFHVSPYPTIGKTINDAKKEERK